VGTPGRSEGEFHLPHSIAFDPDGKLYGADRANKRIQTRKPARARPAPCCACFIRSRSGISNSSIIISHALAGTDACDATMRLRQFQRCLSRDGRTAGHPGGRSSKPAPARSGLRFAHPANGATTALVA
jgi:hypothetical protein